MIERIYVNNFRCLENFTLDLTGRSSALIIGKNGAGKSTLRQALEVFQGICRSPGRLGNLIQQIDFTQGKEHLPMRFEVTLTREGKRFEYTIAFEFPENFREAKIAEESLSIDSDQIFSRHEAQVELAGGSSFSLDWHIPALPAINFRPQEKLIGSIKTFFASMILIEPIPANMSGFSEADSETLLRDGTNFSSCFNALLSRFPASYNSFYSYLKSVIPDLASFENVPRGEKGKQLRVKFEKEDAERDLAVDYKQLSNGEKCFFLSALIVATSKVAPVFCMWDEPDNHLSLSEVGHFITQLRKLPIKSGQFIATSHHPATIRSFSDENTFVFTRKSHLEPTVVRPLTDFSYNGDLIEALIRDEIIG